MLKFNIIKIKCKETKKKNKIIATLNIKVSCFSISFMKDDHDFNMIFRKKKCDSMVKKIYEF